MNIAQANAIPLSEILKKLGLSPTTTRGVDLWYLSPFRNEKTASFHVNASKNVWYDQGEGMGGKVIGFVCEYLKHTGQPGEAKDALRWLRGEIPSYIQPVKPQEEPMAQEEPTLSVQSTSPLQNKHLLSYLESRGIPLGLGKRYLKEILVHNGKTKKTFYALGFLNDEGGFELRNRFFKGSIAPKYVSFVRGRISSGDDVHVFEGFLDFLSAVQYEEEQQFKGDAIILNSLSKLKLATAYIKDHTYKTIHTWFDNDHAGQRASEAFKCISKECKMDYKPMNEDYAPHKDVNTWHMHKRGLPSLS